MNCRYCAANAVFSLRADGETYEVCREHAVTALDYFVPMKGEYADVLVIRLREGDGS